MNKFGLLLGLTLVGSAGAAPPPDAMRELLEQTETEQAAVTRLDLSSLTAQQRAFYERGVVLKDGYRFVDSAPGYPDHIADLQRRINRPAGAPVEVIAVNIQRTDGLIFLGQFVESPHRTNLFFRDRDGARVMLTVWNFVASGGRAIIINEFLNASIGSAKGTLGLGHVGNDPRVVWVLGWILPGDKTSAELRVEDRLDAKGEPSRRPGAIVSLGASLLPSATVRP
jgi:hypothetical protein